MIGAEAAKNFFEWAARVQEHEAGASTETKEGSSEEAKEEEGEKEKEKKEEPLGRFEFPLLDDRDKRVAVHSFVKEHFKNINTTTENK